MRLEVGLGLDKVVDGGGLLGGGDLHPDERPHLRVQTVGHEVELAVRRNERDRLVVVEGGQTHALVEVHVFQIDVVTVLARLQLVIAHVKADLVVQAYTSEAGRDQTQLEFGHAGQTDLHFNGTHDLAV